MKRRKISVCWLLVLIILSAISSLASAAEKAQLSIGDKVSVFSDKAYRKNNGRYFEAVGNVVIISGKDTVYGELASLDQDTLMVKIEGNVRLITKDITLYGSHLDYNIATGSAVIRNARILTTEFNLVASELVRINEHEYIGKEAEFTTCKDCAESWSVYGKTMRVLVGQTVQIYHGLAKIKGVNVLYLPYIVLPLQSKRKTGLLFPKISTRVGEGLAFEQPVFIAIDDSKDMTLSPTFWAKRGYGGDFQYRQRIKEMNWFEVNSRGINDTIYEPGKTKLTKSGDEFFRYFMDVEGHQQWTPNLTSHFRNTGARDLDIIHDHPQYTDQRTNSADMGLNGFVNWRQDTFNLSATGSYLRNQLFADPMGFDRQFVQTLPRVSLSTIPYSIIQSTAPMFQHVAVGMDSSYTRFRQVDDQEQNFLRNADRFSVQPYMQWHFLTIGPVSMKSRYMMDQQIYQFEDHREAPFGKNAGLMRSEVSFTMDKVFGLAYEENVPLKYISEKEMKKLREQKESGLAPIQKTEKPKRLVGEMPEFETELTRENIVQARNSYRHSQEFKFLHHYITGQAQYGNRRFKDQIQTNQGWFDYEDAVRKNEFRFGAPTTRTIIPPENTVEFQWSNTLIRKTPKSFNYLVDDKYLRDNFSYSQIGYFNVSQGYLLNNEQAKDLAQKLTRLMVTTGYSAERWSVGLSEFYFHDGNENIYSMSFTRRFESLNLFGNYNYNSFNSANLKTLSVGGQVRPTDTLGLAMVKDVDLAANREIRTVYSFDLMPNNNCWILNLNLRQSLVGNRYSFNIIFNFGDESFGRYKTDYFAMKRL